MLSLFHHEKLPVNFGFSISYISYTPCLLSTRSLIFYSGAFERRIRYHNWDSKLLLQTDLKILVRLLHKNAEYSLYEPRLSCNGNDSSHVTQQKLQVKARVIAVLCQGQGSCSRDRAWSLSMGAHGKIMLHPTVQKIIAWTCFLQALHLASDGWPKMTIRGKGREN